MATGAYNLISDEFDRRVGTSSIAIGEKLENNVWNGATT
jgi:hypothetical protein